MKSFLGAIFALVVLSLAASYCTLKFFPDTKVAAYVTMARDFVTENPKVKKIVSWVNEKIKTSTEERNADLTKEKELPIEVHEIKDEPAPKVKAPIVENGWRGLEESNRISGSRLTGRSLNGKVVLVYVWSADEIESARLLHRMEQIWASFKHKPFVLLASHRGDDLESAKKIQKKKKLSFPFYRDAGFVNEKLYNSYPFIYVVDGSGKLVYHGRSDRVATEVVVDAFSRL